LPGLWYRYVFSAAVVRIDHHLKSQAAKLRVEKEIMQRYVLCSCLLPLLLAVTASANPIHEAPLSGFAVPGSSAVANAHRLRRGRPVKATGVNSSPGATVGSQATGTVQAGNTDAKPGQNELAAAIDALESMGAGSNSGYQRLGPGADSSPLTMGFTGTNTFDGHGDDSDFFRENTHTRAGASWLKGSSAVPEPSSFWFVALCLAGLAIQRRRSRV
jgi:hypothetical protein